MPRERIQTSTFGPHDSSPIPSLRRFHTKITVNDLKKSTTRYLGVEHTECSFETFQNENGSKLNGNDPADMGIIRFSKQLIASAIG